MDPSLVEPVTFGPRGRPPERRLVAAIVVVSLACVGLWWTGAVGPRLEAVVASIEADPGAGRGTLHLEIRNEGMLPVELRGVRVDDRGGPPVGLGPAPLDGRRVPGGEAVRLDVPYTIDCDRPHEYGTDPALGVRVRSALGVTHTRPVRTAAVVAAVDDGAVDPGPLLCPFP